MSEKKVNKKTDETKKIEEKRQEILAKLSRSNKDKDTKDFVAFADDRKNDFEVISTGYAELDRILTPRKYEETGTGGIPRGFLCEFFGPEAGGKSSLCMMLAAAVTRGGGFVLWVDAEGSWVDYWARTHGVLTENVILAETGQPGEKYFEVIKTAASSGDFELIVLDSMASIQPKDLQNADLDKDARIGALARLMHRVCPQLAAAAKKGNSSIILINQVREKIGVMFGNPETTPGGRSVGFYSSLRLRLSQVGSRDSRGIVKDDEEIGIRSNVLVRKSRFGPPFQEAILPIYYTDEKPYPFDMLLDMALSNKIIKCKSKKDKLTGDRIQFFTLEEFSDIDGVMGIDDLKGCLLANTKALVFVYERLDEKGKILDSEIRMYVEGLKKKDVEEGVSEDTEPGSP